MSNDTRALTAPETAEYLRISTRKLWELTNRGAIRAIRIGRCVRYALDDLTRWIDAGCPNDPGAGERLREDRA